MGRGRGRVRRHAVGGVQLVVALLVSVVGAPDVHAVGFDVVVGTFRDRRGAAGRHVDDGLRGAGNARAVQQGRRRSRSGRATRKNVLVLEPGTSAGSAYFVPLAKWIVASAPGWQVWSVERRENLLEDQSELDRFKQGKVTATGAVQLLPRIPEEPRRSSSTSR